MNPINQSGSGFLTLAFGHSKYIRMCKAMAMSFRLHTPTGQLAIITDSSDPELPALFDILIPLKTEYGLGVTQKLYLDLYTPFEKTIFIDSDCLLYRDANELWPVYETPQGFGVQGNRYCGKGDSHYSVANVDEYLNKTGLTRFGRFNGGLYYFDKSPSANCVFQQARALYARRHELPLKAFKNAPVADEPVFGAALELCGIEMLPDCGTLETPLHDVKGLHRIDVRKGYSRFLTQGRVEQPMVIHFNIKCQDYYVYWREMKRLALGPTNRLSSLAEIAVLPEFIRNSGRRWLKQQLIRLKNS